MNKNELVETVKTMIADGSCCKELKDAGKAYLDAVNTDKEATAFAALVQEIKEDICTIDDAIAFFGTEDADKIFGAEEAKKILAAVKAQKAAGEKWCNCPACANGVKILKSVGELN